jgi:hypothetical protein
LDSCFQHSHFVSASNAKACYATGRGIQPRGIRVKDHADFYVHTAGAGEGEVEVHIIGPGIFFPSFLSFFPSVFLSFACMALSCLAHRVILFYFFSFF